MRILYLKPGELFAPPQFPWILTIKVLRAPAELRQILLITRAQVTPRKIDRQAPGSRPPQGPSLLIHGSNKGKLLWTRILSALF